MKLTEWVKGKALSAIKHESPGQDFQKNESDIKQRTFRLANFEKISKPVLVFTTLMIAGTSVTSAYANPAITEDIHNIHKTHQEIRQEITPGYDQFQKMAGHSTLTIVDKNDPNLFNIIEASNAQILPDISQYANPPSDVMESGFSVDKLKEFTYKALSNDPKTFAVAYSTNHKTDLGKLCFVQYQPEDTLNINYRIHIDYSDQEAKLGVAIHELAHCQDMNPLDFSNYEAYANSESLADTTAALMIASRTGNWDYLNHTIGAVRIIHQHDPGHFTVPVLEALKERVDLGNLQPLTQKEAFAMAREHMDSLDLQSIEKQRTEDIVLNLGYQSVVFEGRNWFSLPRYQSLEFVKLGIDNEADFMNAIESYGIKKIEAYANHINYKSLEDNPLIVKGLARHLGQHGKIFGDQKMADYGMQMLRDYIRHENTKTLDIKDLSETFGFDIDFASKERFQSNLEALSDTYDHYQPKQEKGFFGKLLGAENIESELPVHSEGKDAYLKKLNLYQPQGYTQNMGIG